MLLKELQSLGLDVRVLRDDNTELRIMESLAITAKWICAPIIEGDRRYDKDEESFGDYGFSKQEFEGEELVDIQEEPR